MVDLLFLAQTALFTALEAAAIVPSGYLRDKPLDNMEYPYVVLTNSTSAPANAHDKKIRTMYFTFLIATKPAPGTGTAAVKALEAAMVTALDHKKLSMGAGATMIICKFDNSLEISAGIVQSRQVAFNVIAKEV